MQSYAAGPNVITFAASVQSVIYGDAIMLHGSAAGVARCYSNLRNGDAHEYFRRIISCKTSILRGERALVNFNPTVSGDRSTAKGNSYFVLQCVQSFSIELPYNMFLA